MKRNIGFIIIAAAQFLNALGIDLKISQTEADTIATGVGGLIAAVGVGHDLIRRIIAKSNK